MPLIRDVKNIVFVFAGNSEVEFKNIKLNSYVDKASMINFASSVTNDLN